MKKKGICLLLVIALTMSLFVGCGNATPKIVGEATKEATYLENKDIVFQTALGSSVFKELKEGTDIVEANNYYIEVATAKNSSNKLTLKGGYVASLSAKQHVFSLVTEGGSADFTLNVIDRRLDNPIVAPNDGVYDKASGVDMELNVDYGKGKFESLKMGDKLLVKGAEFSLVDDKIVLKAEILKAFADGAYVFTLKTTTGTKDFKLKIFDGSAKVVNFDDSVLPSAENFGVAFSSREIVDNGITNASARVKGNGTILYFNRSGHPGLDCTIASGKTYVFTMKLKISDDGNGAIIPTATTHGDWGVLGGRKDVVFCFGNGTWGSKWGYLKSDAVGALEYVNIDGIESGSSITKDANGVYTLTVRFTADDNRELQVATWMNVDLIVDDIDLRKAA